MQNISVYMQRIIAPVIDSVGDIFASAFLRYLFSNNEKKQSCFPHQIQSSLIYSEDSSSTEKHDPCFLILFLAAGCNHIS
jgi:hypothetical protein